MSPWRAPHPRHWLVQISLSAHRAPSLACFHVPYITFEKEGVFTNSQCFFLGTSQAPQGPLLRCRVCGGVTLFLLACEGRGKACAGRYVKNVRVGLLLFFRAICRCEHARYIHLCAVKKLPMGILQAKLQLKAEQRVRPGFFCTLGEFAEKFKNGVKQQGLHPSSSEQRADHLT